MDGSHPAYDNHIGYGWIEKGKDFPIKSQDGRKWINLLGVYDPYAFTYQYPENMICSRDERGKSRF
jgi:hypothetical protein